jgi:hypothetical protein
MRPMLVAMALLTGPARAEDQHFEPDASALIEFQMPSGNVACTFVPKGGTDTYLPQDGGPELACTRVEPEYVVVISRRAGPAERIENSGEQGCCAILPVPEYGNLWREGPLLCRSAKSGLECSTATGHGLRLARAGVEVWWDAG